MRKILFYSLVIVCSFGFRNEQKYRKLKNESFKKGEHIEYLVHYGPINAGSATIDVSPKVYLLNNRVCYRVEVVGKTIGAAGVVTRVNDLWRTYIDTTAFVTHRFYRKIEEGPFRRKEKTDFKPLTNSAVMNFVEYREKDAPEKRKKGQKVFNIPDYAQDMISGYYYLRTIDFNKLKKGEIITVPGILEDEQYDLKIRYLGKETTKSKFGKINAHRLVPIMPENGLFSGESSIRFWVSDDLNRVPVRVEADMFIGKIVIEMKNYKNLRHKFNFAKN